MGALVFLIPALAVDQRDPKASVPDLAAGLAPGAVEDGVD